MKQHELSVYTACAVLAVTACGWAYVWYSATSAVFSDLADYGIVYGSEPFTEIVATTQRHIIGIVSPVAAVLIISVTAWGIFLLRRPINPSPDADGVDNLKPSQ
jgi:hypothetical protein